LNLITNYEPPIDHDIACNNWCIIPVSIAHFYMIQHSAGFGGIVGKFSEIPDSSA